MIENDVVRFDDFATNKDGNRWGYMCKECVEKYGINQESVKQNGGNKVV